MNRIGTALAIMLLAAGGARAQMPSAPPAGFIEQSAEYRFQLDLQVNAAALARMLPAGWESAAAASGPAKDCNLRLIFIDRVNIVGPDGKIVGAGSDRLAILAAPVRQTGGSGPVSQMILDGISDSDPGAAGAFGVLAKATRSKMAHGIDTGQGPPIATEDWDFAVDSGAHMQLHVRYTRGAPGRNAGEVRFYNPANPAQYRIVKTETATDILRNVTTTPQDRVLEFSFSVGGGKTAPLFDGSEKPLSWDSQPTYVRTIMGQ